MLYESHVQQHAEDSLMTHFLLHSAFDGAVPNGGPKELCHGTVLRPQACFVCEKDSASRLFCSFLC